LGCCAIQRVDPDAPHTRNRLHRSERAALPMLHPDAPHHAVVSAARRVREPGFAELAKMHQTALRIQRRWIIWNAEARTCVTATRD